VDVHRSLQVLLRHVPEQYLNGLNKITLTNSESLRGTLTSEKRRVRRANCRGLYSRGQILLIVDQIFFDCPELFLLIPPFKTFLIGEVLYHEVGHHIHRTREPGYRTNKEAVADEWKDKLRRSFLRRRYWYLAGTVRLLAPLLRLTRAGIKRCLAEDEP
jgi:hypothetical protein